MARLIRTAQVLIALGIFSSGGTAGAEWPAPPEEAPIAAVEPAPWHPPGVTRGDDGGQVDADETGQAAARSLSLPSETTLRAVVQGKRLMDRPQ